MEQHSVPNLQKLVDWFKATLAGISKNMFRPQHYARDESPNSTTAIAAEGPDSILPRDPKFKFKSSKDGDDSKKKKIDCDDVDDIDVDGNPCSTATSSSAAAPSAKPFLGR